MDKMQDNKGTPTKSTGTKDYTKLDNVFTNKSGDAPEIDQPDPSIATPAIPQEMPIREIK